MKDIIIKFNDGYNVYCGDKYAKKLSVDEAIAVVNGIMLDNATGYKRPHEIWMQTKEQHDRAEEHFLRLKDTKSGDFEEEKDEDEDEPEPRPKPRSESRPEKDDFYAELRQDLTMYYMHALLSSGAYANRPRQAFAAAADCANIAIAKMYGNE